MDGNRRFAKRLMREPWKGHDFGVKKFEEVLSWCNDIDVSQLTIYTLSIQNLNRPKHEIDYLIKLFKKEIIAWKKPDSVIFKNDAVVNFIGRLDLLPVDVQEDIASLKEMTKNNSNFKLTFCVAYGGREELIDAVHKIATDVKDGKLSPMEVDSDLIDKYVYMPDQPDLIIRTGGDLRTSNFLTWQSAYSEWAFVEKLWPELDKETFMTCVADFKSRDRRFGK